jgi:hypothetical protein
MEIACLLSPQGHRRYNTCRTQAMGGTTYYCPDCDQWQYSYHSCGNRNCNKCGNERAQHWLEKTGKLLLPVEHFMVTVTLPGELRQMVRSRQKLFYGLLMQCTAASLQPLGWDSRFVGGQMAMMGVLHTWGRDLSYHPHVHMIVAGGGLWVDEELWLAGRSDFLMPVKALSKIVAAKFRDELKKQDLSLFQAIDGSVWRGPWVVHCQPVGKGQAALKYLATYIFRPAISNGRLLSLENGIVSFRYQCSQTGRWKICRLEAIEFIRRYLQHVLPRGFVKVRYYGLYGHRHRERLERLRDTLDHPAGDKRIPSSEQGDSPPSESPPAKPSTCRHCGQPMLAVETVPRSRPLTRWPNAPPDHGRSTRQHHSKQTANRL